jgi:hypothetical protein
LYAQVWTTPISHLAFQYGVSGNGLAKICGRLTAHDPLEAGPVAIFQAIAAIDQWTYREDPRLG